MPDIVHVNVSVVFLLVMRIPQEHLRPLSLLIRLLREDPLIMLLHEVPLRSAILSEFAPWENALIPGGP